jgi:hypothetical protein
VILHTTSFNIIVGILSWTVGLFYLILSFASEQFHPNALIVNWQTWKEFSSEGLDLINPMGTPAKSRALSSSQVDVEILHPGKDRAYLKVDHTLTLPSLQHLEHPHMLSTARTPPYLSDSTPDLSIIDAMRSSMSQNSR